MTTNTKERRDQLLAEAKAICEKARSEKRDLTADEFSTVEGKVTEVKGINDALKDAARSADILGQLDAMAAGVDDNRDGNQFLSLSKGWTDKFAEKLTPYGKEHGAPIGEKAIASGSSVFVDTELTPTPIAMGRPATALLNVIPVTRHGQPAYSYLRQSVRTNNAAVVAEGAVKPTSVYTFVKVDGALSVIAHLSEAIPRYWLEDRKEIQDFLKSEMAYGLQLAIESKVLADINATSGIQTQDFDTSILVTLRKSLTKLEANGYTPSAIVVDPLDWETLELALATTTAIEYNGLPYDAATRRLWNTTVVVANIEAQGTAHVLAQGAVGLDTDTSGVQLQWSEQSNADDWSKNLVRARMEGRFGTSVYTPFGVVKATIIDD